MGKVRFGLSNVHYAVYDSETKQYGPYKKMPGAVSFSLSREGDTKIVYADNTPWASFETNGGYSGDLEMMYVDNEVLTDLMGYVADENGVIVEDTDAKQKQFALAYEVSSNEESQRFVFYNCTFSRPEAEAKTREDTTDPDHQKLSFAAAAQEFPWGEDATISVVKAHIDRKADNETAWNNFIKTVYIPQKPTA